MVLICVSDDLVTWWVAYRYFIPTMWYLWFQMCFKISHFILTLPWRVAWNPAGWKSLSTGIRVTDSTGLAFLPLQSNQRFAPQIAQGLPTVIIRNFVQFNFILNEWLLLFVKKIKYFLQKKLDQNTVKTFVLKNKTKPRAPLWRASSLKIRYQRRFTNSKAHNNYHLRYGCVVNTRVISL